MFEDAFIERKDAVFVCYQFFRQLRDRYGKKPIFTDGALYGTIQPADGLDLSMRYIWYQNEEYDGERFIQYLKDRTECFDDHFPCSKKKENCNRQHVWNWLKLFFLYLYTSTDERMRFNNMFVIGGGSA